MKKILLIGRNFNLTQTLNEIHFADELSRFFSVVFYGELHDLNRDTKDLQELIDENDFEAVICMYNTKHSDLFYTCEHDNKILITADLHKFKWAKKTRHVEKFMVSNGIKQILSRSLNDIFKQAGAKLFYWSLCEESFSYKEDDKIYDICIMGCDSWPTYPMRGIIKKHLKKRKYKTLYGRRSSKGKYAQNYEGKEIVGHKYIKALQQSKIMIFDSSIYKYPVKKYFEAMASGALILADKPNNAKKIGLINGETYIEINRGNWEQKVKIYLSNAKERNRITKNARRVFEENHTNKIRVKQLFDIIDEG